MREESFSTDVRPSGGSGSLQRPLRPPQPTSCWARTQDRPSQKLIRLQVPSAIVLMLIAKKMKAIKAIILFVIAFITMLGMGYLSAKFDDSSSMHWMAQGTNIISNLALYLGVRILHKKWQ